MGFKMREEGAGPNEYKMDLWDLKEDLAGKARALLAHDGYLDIQQRTREVESPCGM